MPMGLFQQAFFNSVKDTQVLIKNEAGFLLGLFMGFECLDQLTAFVAKSHPQAEMMAIPFALLELNFALVESFLILVLVFRRLYEIQNKQPRGQLFADLKHYALPIFTEGLRAFGITLLYTLLLILPGIYKYVKLTFVMNIVLTDPEYAKGEVDAIKESERLTSDWVWLPLLGLLVLFGAGTWYLEFSTKNLQPLEDFIPWLASFIGLSFMVLYFNILLFEIYSVRKKSLG